MSLVVGVRCSFRSKDAGSVGSGALRARPRTPHRGEQRGPAAQTLFRHALLGVVLLALAGCGGSTTTTGTTFHETGTTQAATTTRQAATGGCRTVALPAAKPDGGQKKPTSKLDPGKTYRVTLETNCGDLTIEIDQRSAPATGASFVALAKQGFFDDTIFHRIVPGFVIQGGDPTASGTGSPGYKTVDPPKPGARYVKYVVAMAKTQSEAAGTSGSQFFIVTADDAGLPPDYAILGRVVAGKNVVDRIGRLGDVNEQPTQVVEIVHARVAES
jgi:peptidyl-prolyl cis-trans isomerase B (cyclophilin B)